jgi:hypothetical protein
MSNVNSPFGFRDAGLIPGGASNFTLSKGLMAYNASAVYWGDPLIISSGKLAVATVTGNTGAAIAGVAVYFTWISTAQGKRAYQPWYPGSDSVGNADVTVHYISDPNCLLVCQSSGTAIPQTVVGQYANFTTGTPSTLIGSSGMSLDQTTLNATAGALPFQVVGFPIAPALNSDITSSYNLVFVKMANITVPGIN